MSKFRALGTGLDVSHAGERWEMDDWNVQLSTILIQLGMGDVLTPEQLKSAERIRLWVTIVLDAATRCVMGLAFSKNPDVRSALAALRMAVSDKTAIAKAAGAESSWRTMATPELLATDAGSYFAGDRFKVSVAALGIEAMTLPAGQPQLRGRGERFFGTIHRRAVTRLPGRTFENAVRLGGYDSEARASLTSDDIQRLLILWIVDVYHNTPHTGLNGRTPANVWRDFERFPGVRMPPTPNLVRHALGDELTAMTGPHGIRVFTQDYACEALHRFRETHGDKITRVRVNTDDIGRISVDLGGRWFTCACRTANLDGISLQDWRRTDATLRMQNRLETASVRPIVDRALDELRAITTRAMLRVGLVDDEPTAAQAAASMARLRIGVRLPQLDAPDGINDDPDAILRGDHSADVHRDAEPEHRDKGETFAEELPEALPSEEARTRPGRAAESAPKDEAVTKPPKGGGRPLPDDAEGLAGGEDFWIEDDD